MNQDAAAPNPDQNQTSQDAPQIDGPQVARVNRGWLLKIVAVMIVVVGFGIWGFYDATVVYPERGYRASQFLEWQHLQKLAESNQLTSASIDDPAAVHKELSQRQKQGMTLSSSESTRLSWLGALKNTRLLSPEFTRIPRTNPRETVTSASERLTQLTSQWTQASGPVQAPKPLTGYDIPVQWLFVAIGLPVGLYQMWLITKVLRQKHRFDPATQTLSLADGTTLTPAQLADVDKRRWHKYMVSLIPAPGHPRAGQSIEVDLLRHRDLEPWILAMEKTRFPERAAEADAEEAASESEEDSDGESPKA